MIRLFVALAVPENIRERLANLCRGIPEVRWVDSQNMHLTLRFIGEVEEPLLVEIDSALSTIRSSGLNLVLNGVGMFGDSRRARVLWAGIQKSDELIALRLKIESALTRIGLGPENKKFQPHITLARVKGIKVGRFVPFLTANAAFMTEEFSVAEIFLYSSYLARNGATYSLEASYPLASA